MCEHDRQLPDRREFDPREPLRPDSEIHRLLVHGRLDEIASLINGAHRVPSDYEMARVSRSVEIAQNSYAETTASGIFAHVQAVANGSEYISPLVPRSYEFYFLHTGHFEAVARLESLIDPNQTDIWQRLQMPRLPRRIGRAAVIRSLLRYEVSDIREAPLLLSGLQPEHAADYAERGFNFGLRYEISSIHR